MHDSFMALYSRYRVQGETSSHAYSFQVFFRSQFSLWNNIFFQWDFRALKDSKIKLFFNGLDWLTYVEHTLV